MTSDKARAVEERLGNLISALFIPVAVRTTGPQTVGSETQGAITGLSVSLPAGSFYYRSSVPFTALSTNEAYLTMGGTATVTGFRGAIAYSGGGAGPVVRQQVTLGSNASCNSFALDGSSDYLAVIDGTIDVSGAGTLVVNGAASANADTFDTLAGATLFACRLSN